MPKDIQVNYNLYIWNIISAVQSDIGTFLYFVRKIILQKHKIKVYYMSESGIFLDYQGHIDFTVIDLLLKKLKKSKDFTSLNKLTSKRTYAIIVECLENISRHSSLKSSNDPKVQPYLFVRAQSEKIFITSGNPVHETEKENLAGRLDKLNDLDEVDLKAFHEYIINGDSKVGEKGAGLGFITMALKSGNKIAYSFEPLIDGYLYFEMQISLNKFTMRKLIIDKTSSSPKVILDPEKKIYTISGESRPPDARDFYNQILSWIEDFGSYIISSDLKKEPVEFNFNFEYFNSSSGKLILDIFKVLAGLRLKGINILVKWHFEKDDSDMMEAGKEMSKIVKFPFEFIESGAN